MFSYSELHQLNQRYNLNHPIFECYDISIENINYRSFILRIDHLTLLVEATHDRVKTGIIKVLESTENSISYNRDLTNDQTNINSSDWTNRYRIRHNLALLDPSQTKEFEKTYKEQYKKFKKAIKEYEKLRKIDRKEALKKARKDKSQPLI